MERNRKGQVQQIEFNSVIVSTQIKNMIRTNHKKSEIVVGVIKIVEICSFTHNTQCTKKTTFKIACEN